MKILAIIIFLFLMGLANAYSRKQIEKGFGYNIGKKYMKEQWDIDEKDI